MIISSALIAGSVAPERVSVLIAKGDHIFNDRYSIEEAEIEAKAERDLMVRRKMAEAEREGMIKKISTYECETIHRPWKSGDNDHVSYGKVECRTTIEY